MDEEQARRAALLAFLASGRPFELGSRSGLPLPPERLARLAAGDPGVIEVRRGGLTAEVLRVRADGRDWAVKRARPESLVRTDDGRVAFLNELQRRREFEQLRAMPHGRTRWRAVVPTVWGSLRDGLVISPWIAGDAVATWNERRHALFFEVGIELLLEGFFDWDPCAGNLLDDGERIVLFDFGYTYRFDPLRQFNSAGDGRSSPQFHLAERLETRNLSAGWLDLEDAGGATAAIDAFAVGKRVALDAYRRIGAALLARGASAAVLDWLEGIADRWQAALHGDLAALYREEAVRSHRLDVDDDLQGHSTTALTLRRIDWLARQPGAAAGELAALRRAAEARLVSSIP